MINNRQNGRRRGRGGGQGGAPRPNGSNGGQDRGNRIDNRARGNAAQLLEKYKALARDAQMQGDRVNTEYYLQFADHYFRVLSESRSRFEEQQPRPRRDDFAQQSDEDYGDEGERVGSEDQQAPTEQSYAPRDRGQGGNQGEFNGMRSDDDRGDDRGERNEERRPRRDRGPREDRRYETAQESVTAPAPAAAEASEEEAPARRRGRPPKAKPSEQIDADRLPPSLSLQSPVNDGDEEAERPRRGRKPRGETAAA